MRLTRLCLIAATIVGGVAASSTLSSRQAGVDPASAMHWRQIGPSRAGRARPLAGVPSQPNVFYVGFDNGGVWRSTDYGSNWTPIFDRESTGSIGAIAVAPSNPQIIYVGTGAAIIRPDLSTGNGVYKSTDAGKTWTHLGLFDSQMIAMIDVDPRDPNRLFVAALGHPYGPNAERGVFRSTDGGKTFQKVLYKDEYTSANDVRIDPSEPNTVYAALWVQQQSYIEGGAFGSTGGGIFKSTDGGTTWKQLIEGLPAVIQANLGVAPGDSKILYATIAGGPPSPGAPAGQGAAPAGRAAAGGPPAAGAPAGRGGGGSIGLYKSVDGGDHWFLAVRGPNGSGTRTPDNRPLGRIGGGDLPPVIVDPKNPDVLYTCSTVLWRSEDAGQTWSAVRGAPGGDDYQGLWINPNNTDIIFAVADQGAVVSGNRGTSWSNWYTQPTAAMYHVTTDNAFPYRVCGGQQDSGSACVDSRGNDGQITFRNWSPVGIQEYGEAAPDPKNPDLVYGSSRNNVTLFNRKTGQIKNVGPDLSAPDAKGMTYTRNVRTMPLEWSPVNPSVLFYAQNAVFQTADGGRSWARISGDLTRQAWDVPANTGKYASGVTPAPTGSITALSPSPIDANVLWAGTDDGRIQVMTGVGRTWTNVTPAAIKPWTRIFNIEAGHFSALTAYAAANTMRLDDMNPHFWRTDDGGKTWKEINTGLPSGAVSNSIREDPRQKGLLYAATETQVWVSFDDGDHWQSLRLDMPAVSVRDIAIKDDATCMCSDLVAGTHGRGFWILDDVAPLRQAAALRAAEGARAAYLVKPVTAVRVRFGMNPPTPWPPEVPAGENPPPGAILDYYLAADAAGPVTLEILDTVRRVVRTYSSTDPVPAVHPAIDPIAYNKICQETPNAPDCSLPLYWPAPPMVVSTRAGMHRVWWDMHYDPIGEGGGGRGGGGSAGAVPHRTYPSVNSPWAPPGSYTVRLTVDGKNYTQPIALKIDPRVTASAADLATLASLTSEMYEGARTAHAAYQLARALVAQLDTLSGDDVTKFKAAVVALAPAAGGGSGAGRGGRGAGAGAAAAGGRGGPPSPGASAGQAGRSTGGAAAAPTLQSVSTEMSSAAMAMQAAEIAPTAREVAACATARTNAAAVMAKWTALTSVDLAAFNAKRKAAGQLGVLMPKR
ncbi:MAG: glycoside hydrolase [Acidobacteria bacterium]|nr:glycoside hydrolase [Acidobacteriota bacterium]